MRKRLASVIAIASLAGGAALSPAVAAQAGAGAEAALEEILVRGQRATIRSAQEIKRASEQIVDSIVADDIGKLPDRSVTETLQRVPGVTIERFIDIGDPEHFSAEGSGVAIRGMSHVRSELNGRDSFAASGGRSLSFEDVPAELMAGVDVYKNPSADMIEGGLGGTVNLRTKMPLDIDGQQLSVSASVNYGDFAKEYDPSASLLYSNRWHTDAGEMGFLVDVAYSEISTRTDGVFLRPFFARTDIADDGSTTWLPRGADWRSMNFNRERLGTYGAFQWRPNNESEFYATIFRSQYDMQWDEDAIFVSNDPWAIQLEGSPGFEDGVFRGGRLTNAEPPEWAPQVPGIPFGADIRVSTRESITTDYAAGYRWIPVPEWEVSTDFQYTESTTDALDATVATEIGLPWLDVDVTATPPSIRADANYLADPTNYYWAFTMPHIEDARATQFAWRADAEYQFDSDVFRSVKFGVRFTDREADNIDTGYDWQAIFAPWMTTDWGGPLNVNELGMPYMQDGSQMNLNTFDNFFRGGADLEGVVWAPALDLALGYPDSFVRLHEEAAAYADSLGHPYSAHPDYGSYNLRDPHDPEWRNIQEEQTLAAYGLLRFGFEDLPIPIDGNIGVRVVQTDATASGNLILPQQEEFGGGASMPLVMENTYTNVLPSLNLRFQLRDDLIARFALSQAVSRPEFHRMRAFLDLNANVDGDTGEVNFTGQSGNPDLRPLEADQADLSFEWYFSEEGGMAHLNFFYKDIQGIIREQTVVEEYGGNDYSINRPVNAGSAKIRGFEVGYSQFFDFLPAPFDGLGAQFNYTHIDSSTNIPLAEDPWNPGALIAPVDTDGTLISENLPYEGLSEHAFNLVGMYERGAWSGRLAWSWRSEYLMSVGPNGFNGTDGGVNNSQDIAWKLPIYSDDTGQLDGSVFYQVNDNVSIGLEANNITNEQTRTIMRQSGAGDHYASYFVNDTRYALTVRATF